MYDIFFLYMGFDDFFFFLVSGPPSFLSFPLYSKAITISLG